MGEETLATLIRETREDVADIKARIESLPDHEGRLRSLERFRYAVPGAALVGVAVALGSMFHSLL
jgi:50S ribosomal subunit-associated GTPase HflX